MRRMLLMNGHQHHRPANLTNHNPQTRPIKVCLFNFLIIICLVLSFLFCLVSSLCDCDQLVRLLWVHLHLQSSQLLLWSSNWRIEQNRMCRQQITFEDWVESCTCPCTQKCDCVVYTSCKSLPNKSVVIKT